MNKNKIIYKNRIMNKIKITSVFTICLVIYLMTGLDTAKANMAQSEIQKRLAPYSKWIETDSGEVELVCPREDISENEMFYYIKDISALLKGVPGEDYCEVDISFPYTVEKNGTNVSEFSKLMFEREERLAYYITNWSDLNSLNMKVGRKYVGNETLSYNVVMEIVQNGTKDYFNSSLYYEKLQSIVNEARLQATTEMEMVHYFCQWLEDNVVYDISLTTNSAYVAIMEQRALCGSYANALKDLCSLVGIETLVPTNDSLVHAWSEVYIDGVWYTVDLCNVVKSIKGVQHMEYFFTDPNYTVDYVYFYNYIKAEIAKSTPMLTTANIVTITGGTYDISKNIRNLGDNAVISYSSSDTSIFTVDTKGIVTPINKGTAVITINIKLNNASYTLKQTFISTYQSTEGKIANLKKTKAKLKKAKNLKGKKVKLTWKKVSNASGYQIRYARNKKFTKSKKNVYAKKSAKSKTIKKLKEKKNYYFKVRAYIKVNGKKVYSKWSKVKKVKIKR